MAASSQPAFVLEDETLAASGDGVHFGGFPGVWRLGEPIALSELGFTDLDEAWAKVEDLGLPLLETTVDWDAGEGRMPRQETAVEGVEPGAQLEPGEVFPPDPVVTVEALAEEMAPALEQTAADVVGTVAIVETLEGLDALEQAERDGKARKTVLAAIKDRRAELEAGAWGSETAPSGDAPPEPPREES